MKRIALILNPSAGKGQLLELLDTITSKLQQHCEEVTIYQTEKEGDGADKVREIASEVDLIIAAGGDGTVHELVNAISALDQPPAFAILPGGTCNDFCRTIGMDQDPLIALEQILRKQALDVDVGYSSQGRYFLNFWGIGLITQVSLSISSEDKERLGRLAYYFSAAQNILETDPFHLEVTVDQKTRFDGEATLLVVGNGSFIGGMQGFFPQSRINDSHLDVLILKETSLASAWSMLLSNWTNDWPESDHLLYFHTDALTITASPEQTIDCDGEKGEHTPVDIKVLPKYLTVLVGDLEDSALQENTYSVD
ncbi:lipid kinase, YegS/Rv2252/BmrU family [Marininema mesophilum]|uniref:Lipid kinase, YegS/Rv2252/BmrU family n=1 Tax=Marininema mesophilum TaxID=1048340 RepID=A0A1H2VSA3_9BACL|nr:diacylglycerol kinase family protein [Marininema mesophilum]SDW71117.1 lipid kinase, YegS/Rv2252/BmrU family [Marininema mesophilum]